MRAADHRVAALRDLDSARPIYILPRDPFVDEVLLPGFRTAESAECMVGYFASTVLAELAPGLAVYLNRPDTTLRLIVSPFLQPEDLSAIEDGIIDIESVASQVVERLLVTVDELERHTLRCLAHLLKRGQIDMRVAVMRRALFHPKAWIFSEGADFVAAHGSSNLTQSGLRTNFEQVSVSKSWSGSESQFVVKTLRDEFGRLWANSDPDCVVVDLPSAVRDNLLRTYGQDSPPTELDFDRLYRKRRSGALEGGDVGGLESSQPRRFAIPPGLKYQEGPFAHQGEAVDAWCQAGHHGILEMATGSGKTITAMICASRLYEAHRPLLVVIAAPFRPLIAQWSEEVEKFGVIPKDLTSSGGPVKRERDIRATARRLRHPPGIEFLVVSHDTLVSSEFQASIDRLPGTKLLIADEVHNLGREAFITSTPEFFDYRLGLSATPVRQYDEEGTKGLFEYFGNVVFQFTLDDAIGTCLVPYDYLVHLVVLSPQEMDDYREISGKIRKNAWREQDSKPDEYLAKLYRDRRLVLEIAAEKLSLLEDLLGKVRGDRLEYTLIYATDKDPKQLQAVNRILGEKGVLFHQLTSEETSDQRGAADILRSFRAGDLQVLTAKRVLDEGVNVPEIRTAFVLASTTVERQWVQRRGRLLRMCAGKSHATIHDFVTLPPEDQDDPDTKRILQGELKRVQEFARLASNAARDGGPLEAMQILARRAYS